MSSATYYIGSEVVTWPTSSAMVCHASNGSKSELSAIIEWDADDPSGEKFQWFAWIKDITLTNGHAKLTTRDLNGDSAGLYYGDFPELFSVDVNYSCGRIKIEMILIRADGTASEQRCCIDIENWAETPRHELRFP